MDLGGAAARERREDAAAEHRLYLIAFEDESSWMFELPAPGEVVIGRSPDVDLYLRDQGISRRHAALRMNDHTASVMDLGSQNGTRVNGELLVGSRPLMSGDIITLGRAALVFHARPREQCTTRILDFDELRNHARRELSRALRYQRPLSVLAISLGVGAADRPRAERALAEVCQPSDIACWYGRDQLLLVVPEAGAEEAADRGRRLRSALKELAPLTRVGIASCPSDGCDVDTLICGARTAADRAEPGKHLPAARTYQTLEIGDREVVVADPAMARVYDLLRRLAVADLPVTICGETGTGKELSAEALHHWSPRRDERFVILNCAAVPDTLIESELFGHARGAFSGATSNKPGLLEAAAGGTVFLDEIGEMSGAAQAKLLRVLESKRTSRLGEVHERPVDIRVLAATNRDLEEEIRANRFRKDLFFRLGGARIWLPPLRDRPRELPILAERFMEEACTRIGRDTIVLTNGALQRIADYPWPGNIRQLRNMMEYLAAAVTDNVVEAHHIEEQLTQPGALGVLTSSPGTGQEDAAPSFDPPGRFVPIADEIRQLERRRMREALSFTGGNQTRAARLIGMPLRTFVAKLKQYDLR